MFVLTGSGLDSDDEDGTEDRNDLRHTESIAWHYSALAGLLQPTLDIYRGRAGGGHSVHTSVKNTSTNRIPPNLGKLGYTYEFRTKKNIYSGILCP